MEQKVISAQDQRNQEILEAGLATADCYITRSYLIDLAERTALEPDPAACQDVFLRLYHIDRFVYDKTENVNDKLISVYSALHEIDGSAILVIRGSESCVDYYLGVRSERKAALCGPVLEKSLLGNFPGSSTRLLKTSEASALLNNIVGADSEQLQNISAVSVIPSGRDEDKDKFVQGIEKFIDTMQGETYTAVFVASPISKTDLEYRKRGLEELASALSPFAKTTLAYGENYSKAVSTGMFENFSSSINRSISNTAGHNSGTNASETTGTNQGFSLIGLSTGRNRSRTAGYSSGTNWSKAVTDGTADTTGKGTNTSDTETTGDSRTMTVEHINKSVESLLKTIDEQLERIKSCEAFGLWDCAAYFLAPQIQVSVMAANTYKALVSGDDSSVENAYVNVWDTRNENTCAVQKSLRYGLHPQIQIPSNLAVSFDSQVVSPGSFVSGKELSLFMGFPQKSVSGLTVSAIAEFGRNVFTLDGYTSDDPLPIGHVFHMGRPEKAAVSLDVNSFTSHCFIAGSTGSGKSNTSYVLLNEFYKKGIPFLVIEPAKGEYKEEFGALPGIHIFSTNPRYGQMLRLNPFWFDAEQIHVLEHLDRLVEIFNACWEMYAAMPAILKAGAERIYTEKGWDTLNSIYLGEGEPQFPTFADLLRVLPEIIKTSSYSADTQGDYTGALVTRVASLTNGIFGQIFCSGSAIPDSVLFDENTIVDLSRVGAKETKSLIMGLLVMKLTEYRTAQASGSNRKLRHVTVLEEAHNLLKRTGTDQGQDKANMVGQSVQMISNSIAEMRTYGEGFIIIDQSPTSVDIAAIKNTNTKIIMRLPEQSDCEAVGNAMALNEEQVKELAKLPVGVAAVMQSNWLETVLVKVDAAPHAFCGQLAIADPKELAALRAKAVEMLMRQYFNDRRLDKDAVASAVRAMPGADLKKEELLYQVSAVIDRIGSDRNVKAITQGLLEISCCKAAFDINDRLLQYIDTEVRSDADYNALYTWQTALTQSVKGILPLPTHLIPFFVRNILYAKSALSNDGKYLVMYDMLYGKLAK